MEAVELKRKLSMARDQCPWMLDCDYQFADYLASNLSDRVTPTEVVEILSLLMMDMAKYEQDHNATIITNGFPRWCSLSNAPYILQIIDGVAFNESFSDEVRKLCAEAFGWDVPKRPNWHVDFDREDKYPEYVKAAVDWWTDAIQHSRKTIEAGDMILPALTKELSEDDVYGFRWELAVAIILSMDRCRHKYMTIKTDYGPVDLVLLNAASAANIDDDEAMFMFPSKTTMTVTPDRVSVQSWNNSAITIWDKEHGKISEN